MRTLINPLSAAILTSVADDYKRHWDAGRFGRAPHRDLSPRDVSIVRKRRRIRGCLAIDSTGSRAEYWGQVERSVADWAHVRRSELFAKR